MNARARLPLVAAMAMAFLVAGLPEAAIRPGGDFAVKPALAIEHGEDVGDSEDAPGGDDDGGDGDGDGGGGSGGDDGGDGGSSGGSGSGSGSGNEVDAEAEDNPEMMGQDRGSHRAGYEPSREILAIDADPAALRRLEAEGFVVRGRDTLASLGISISRLAIPPSLVLTAALARARQLAPRTSYEPNPTYRLAADPPAADQSAAVPCAGPDCYPQRLMGWPMRAESCGGGLRVGMTDTAIDLDHPAFRGRSVELRGFARNGVAEGSPTDHGTAVAALLIGDPASAFAGMLPSAQLFAADVFHGDGAGRPRATLADLVRGLDWLASRGVSVINVSMAGPPNWLLEQAVDRLAEHGIAVVAAAGNDGPGASPVFPAAYDNVVSVTAVDEDLRAYRMANRGDYIAFASPGVDVWSAAGDGSGRYRTGTSLAAAHVSAAIAEITGRRDIDPDAAIGSLRRTVRDLGTPGRDRVFGWGLIQTTSSCPG